MRFYLKVYNLRVARFQGVSTSKVTIFLCSIFLRIGPKMQNFVPGNMHTQFMQNIRICQPCTISAYKSQNLVLTKRVLSRKVYLQIIVTLRYVSLIYDLESFTV
jgi:hypothetical protein